MQYWHNRIAYAPLAYAAHYGRSDIVRYLHKQGANPFIKKRQWN